MLSVRFAAGLGLCTRRGFLACAGAGLGFPALIRAAEASPMAPFDREMESFMSARGVPGGALMVIKAGRLVYARGYGWADRERRAPAGPDTLFRVASLSKSITAAAVLQLIERGRLDWETRAFPLLGLAPLAAKPGDARLAQITVRQLLQHTGGWDRDRSGDPMFQSRQIARAAGEPSPASPEAVIRDMLGRPLDFAPGERQVYSNFGYCVLGRVIEKVVGRSYESWVRESVLAPSGVRAMRIGASRESGFGEARYYTPTEERGRNVFADSPEQVPVPYGAFCLESMDAHGGWVASARDLARMVVALDAPGPAPLLKPETLALMQAPPPAPAARLPDGRPADWHFGCGWVVRSVPGASRPNLWHNGSLPGTWALVVRRFDGISWGALFNQRSAGKLPSDDALDGALHRAAGGVKEWPDGEVLR